MNLITLKLSEIKPYPNNPRNNDAAVDAVAESIKQYGFNVPMVVDVNHVIICGHTRYKAAMKLGLKEVPCVIADKLTQNQVNAYRIADNKTSDLSIWDNVLLLKELESIGDDFFTGFQTSDYFDDTLEETGHDLEKFSECADYEVTFRSKDPNLIEAIKKAWNEMAKDDEQ